MPFYFFFFVIQQRKPSVAVPSHTGEAISAPTDGLKVAFAGPARGSRGVCVCVCVFILVGPLLTLRSSSPNFINQREEKSSTSVLRNLAGGLAEAEPTPSSVVPSATSAETAHHPGSVCMRASSHGALCQIYGSASQRAGVALDEMEVFGQSIEGRECREEIGRNEQGLI